MITFLASMAIYVVLVWLLDADDISAKALIAFWVYGIGYFMGFWG